MAIETTRRRLLISTFALCAAGCREQTPDLSGFTQEEPPHLSSAVRMGDPQTASQLLSGWYKIEQNHWRWTAGNFAAVLRPPPGSAALGAVLALHFNIPEIVITLLKAVTISASLAGLYLSPETYLHAGDYAYARDIAPGVLSGASVRVDFALAKAIPPAQSDGRELGVIATLLSLETK